MKNFIFNLFSDDFVIQGSIMLALAIIYVLVSESKLSKSFKSVIGFFLALFTTFFKL